MKLFMWVSINSGNRSGGCSENYGFRIAQVVGIGGMPVREWNFVFREWNFEFRNLLREWSFHSESVFPEIRVVPRLPKIRLKLFLGPL